MQGSGEGFTVKGHPHTQAASASGASRFVMGGHLLFACFGIQDLRLCGQKRM